MLALTANFMAFYLAVMLFERTGILCAVTAFVVTASSGTIIASIIEESLFSLLSGESKARGGNRSGRSAVTTPLP